jgi:hypothetical protein
MSSRPSHHTNDTKSGFRNPWNISETKPGIEQGNDTNNASSASNFNVSNWMLPSMISQGLASFPLEWAKEHKDHPHPPVKVVKPSFGMATSERMTNQLTATWLGHAVGNIHKQK